MTSLKSLNFTTLPKTETDPKLERRARTIVRLEEQKVLLANPNFVRKVRSFKQVDGVRKSVESDQRVNPWWRKHIDGSYLFTIKSGSKSLEFEKGKAAIAVPSLDKLPTVIDTLIAATRTGELDTQLAQASRTPPTRKKTS
ncbi:MAG: hypothetical protein ACJAVZ_001351 [Afipia broomeae]|jgi:hypothetical protein|uniref:Uncharacterized protein n=1 Tax=Candidatus Afipia apatlaquensis TaxID=2712852 RepID=A0A7C9RIZ8_9BRAD|nr:hypothetical protein [Afipia sp.]NGX98564.1 hypothetical protein [Candidatus Afipia apatlaquensis]RTL76013.1 MAG: hypothetical protein EKK35_20930 [Bradyrhizobiaceae bacterium]